MAAVQSALLEPVVDIGNWRVTLLDSAVPGYKVRTMALPKGLWPKNRQLAWEGTYTAVDKKTKATRTINYKFDAVLEVAGGPTKSPYDPTFDPHSISRVEMR